MCIRMHACMYMCMCVCMHACICIVYVCMHVCVCVHRRCVCVYVCRNVCVHTCIHAMHVHIHKCMLTCMHRHACNTCMHTHTCMHIHACMHIHTCMQIQASKQANRSRLHACIHVIAPKPKPVSVSLCLRNCPPPHRPLSLFLALPPPVSLSDPLSVCTRRWQLQRNGSSTAL